MNGPFRDLAVFFVLAGFCGGCQWTEKPPNILLITVDTLRADDLGGYGSPMYASPALDRLSRQSRLYQMVWAPSPWTLPSLASLMTGLEPKVHGAIHFRKALPQNALTLAEKLRKKGYHTSAAVTHLLLGPDYGFDRGFERFDEELIPGTDDAAHLSVTSERLSEIGVDLLKTAKEPFFVWLHYFDPHFHYMPHPPETTMKSDGRSLYRGEIRFTDAFLGEVMAAAERLPRPPAVIVTADHGEQFKEHGGWHHTTALYQEVVQIPLLIATGAVGTGSVIEGPTRMTDLHQWILDFVEKSVEPPEMPVAREVFLHSEQACNLRGLVEGRYKLIADLIRKRVRLYDLWADPGERSDLAAERVELRNDICRKAAEGFGRLALQGEEIRNDAELEMPEEKRQQLEQLGYLDADGLGATGTQDARLILEACGLVEAGAQGAQGP